MSKKHKRVIVWMRRALRVQDNTPLRAAVQDADEVIPVVCLRDTPDYREDTVRRNFQRGLLRDCDWNLRNLGSRLFVRSGDPVTEIPAAVRSHGADAVYAVRVYDTPAMERDSRIALALKDMGAEFVGFKDSVLFEGSEILSRSGSPYRVFTPYKNAWLSRVADLPRRLPHLRSAASPGGGPGDSSLDRFHGFADVEIGRGETAARKILTEFAAGAVMEYMQKRNLPGEEGTSKLSPYLANGAVSIRTVFWTLRDARAGATQSGRNSIDAYIGELIWREFYYQILQHFPFVLWRAFRDELKDIEWVDDPVRFDAWREGRTGYPIVDAAMRQLHSEGWMHNRARMIVASFLTKDLHINWQWGEKYFLETLIDGDLASNNGGWQWTAGTGTDASPWFRIFNPILQGKKFDPEGAYVRRYVPELARVPVQKIHSPWTLTDEEQRMSGCVPGKTYPLPIVDHSEARRTTLRLYRTPALRRKGSRTRGKEAS